MICDQAKPSCRPCCHAKSHAKKATCSHLCHVVDGAKCVEVGEGREAKGEL